MKDRKNKSTHNFFLSKFHTILSSTVFFRKSIDTCCIDTKKSLNEWEKLLEILFCITKLQQFSKSTLENVLLIP